jgi:thioredoxin reductase (NADPH)
MTTSTRTEPVDHLFPTLVEAHVDRLRRYGQSRDVSAGEVLLEPGTSDPRVFVVVSGSLEIIRETREGETLIHVSLARNYFGSCRPTQKSAKS